MRRVHGPLVTSAARQLAAAGCVPSPFREAQILVEHVLTEQRESEANSAARSEFGEGGPSPKSEAGAARRTHGLLARLVRLRASGMPLAYLTGTKAFFRHDFAVEAAKVLCPRPETELLVEAALECAEMVGGFSRAAGRTGMGGEKRGGEQSFGDDGDTRGREASELDDAGEALLDGPNREAMRRLWAREDGGAAPSSLSSSPSSTSPSSSPSLSLLDLGTGSGCVLLSVLAALKKKESERGESDGEYHRGQHLRRRTAGVVTGVGVDVSAEALEVAAGNARRLGLAVGPSDGATSADVSFVRGSWLDALDETHAHRPFDVVTANPPYLTTAEWSSSQGADTTSPLRFEPELALHAGTSGLEAYQEIYRSIGRQQQRHSGRRLLAEGALVLLEVGRGQAQPVSELFSPLTRDKRPPQLLRDLAGIERVVAFRVA